MTERESFPRHEVHAAAGAVFGERQGASFVTSYGDPAGEYESMLNGAALADLAERGVLLATGPRRQAFLQGMLSNDVEGLAPGRGCRAALMSAKGHVQALIRALVEDEAVRLETDADRVALVERTLEHYRVAAPVRFREAPVAVLAVLGLRGAEILRAIGLEPPLEPEAHRRAGLAGVEVRVARASDLPGGGFVIHAEPGDAPDVWNALLGAGARPVGRESLDARRIEDRRPWYGSDVTEENLLHETGLLAECHSPTKGCYLGQETVARLEARGGHVNKALRRLRLSAPATPGDPVRAADREVGRVTTAAFSPRFGPIALAYVHRSHFAPGTTLDVVDAPATVVDGFDQE